MFDSQVPVCCDKRLASMANKDGFTMTNGRKPKTFNEVGKFFFQRVQKRFETIPDDQARLPAKFFHVIASLFVERATYDFIKAGVIDYFPKHHMMVSLNTQYIKLGRKMKVHSIVAYAKDRFGATEKVSIYQICF